MALGFGMLDEVRIMILKHYLGQNQLALNAFIMLCSLWVQITGLGQQTKDLSLFSSAL